MFFAKIYIGTSGWDYDDWVDPFYSSEKGMFTQYARVFNTTEINSTFYTLPSERFLKNLASYAPPGFKFSLKMYKGITHKKLLNPKTIREELELFLKAVRPMKELGKLGAILVQMPPKSREEIPWFEDFLKLLPSEYRFAVEFRDQSWLSDDVIETLLKYGIAYTIVDEPLLPPVIYVTADFAYIRWHGKGERPWYYYHYSIDELKEWVPKINDLSLKVQTIYGYFNNHFRGFAPHNALQMLSLLGMSNKRQKELLKRMDEYFKRGEAEQVALKASLKLKAGGDMVSVLGVLAGQRRLKRGLDIPDSEVNVNVRDEKIEGQVKKYKVIIDLKNRTIYHDCEDWKKMSESKRICKHLVKFFLSLPEDLARKILWDIVDNIDEWEFRHP